MFSFWSDMIWSLSNMG